MANYAIGDIQGCYEQLRQLLRRIAFKPQSDRLWLVGDLVNRGPNSLAVLRYLSRLPIAPIITLGNHDLHLLAVFHGVAAISNKDTFQDVLQAADAEKLCGWLQQQHLLYYDPSLNYLMAHAGVAPQWSLAAALQYAEEVTRILRSPTAVTFLANMYGNYPDVWCDDLVGLARWRLIINYFTRMRYCDVDGRLELSYKGTVASAPAHLIPWFELPGKCWQQQRVIFGHWAALAGKSSQRQVIALDTGCVWGGSLTAMRLEDGKKFAVPGWRAEYTSKTDES